MKLEDAKLAQELYTELNQLEKVHEDAKKGINVHASIAKTGKKIELPNYVEVQMRENVLKYLEQKIKAKKQKIEEL